MYTFGKQWAFDFLSDLVLVNAWKVLYSQKVILLKGFDLYLRESIECENTGT